MASDITTGAPQPLRIFVSYAHKDQALKEQFDVNLKVLSLRKLITLWSDSHLSGGEIWSRKIENAMREADVILFMVSNSFLASDYIRKYEMPLAMEEVRAGRSVIVPVILKECAWEEEEWSEHQALPTGVKPVSEWSDIEKAFSEVEKGLRKVLQRLREQKLREANAMHTPERAGASEGRVEPPPREEAIRVETLGSSASTPPSEPGPFEAGAAPVQTEPQRSRFAGSEEGQPGVRVGATQAEPQDVDEMPPRRTRICLFVSGLSGGLIAAWFWYFAKAREFWLLMILAVGLSLVFGETFAGLPRKRGWLRIVIAVPLAIVIGFIGHNMDSTFQRMSYSLGRIIFAIIPWNHTRPIEWMEVMISWLPYGTALGVVYGVGSRSMKKYFHGIAGGTLGVALGGFLLDPLILDCGSWESGHALAYIVTGAGVGISIGWCRTARENPWALIRRAASRVSRRGHATLL